MKFFYACILLIVGGCCSQRPSLLNDTAITSDIYGFPHSSNPYTSDELSSANGYLASEIERLNLQNVMSAFFVPTEGSNRLIFVPIRPDYEPTKDVRTKIVEGLENFLRHQINNRPKNQIQPDEVGWTKHEKK